VTGKFFSYYKDKSEYDMRDKWFFRCGATVSHDGGKTFENYGYIAFDNQRLWEPCVIETDKGHVLMFCRNPLGFLALSESFDFGRTWSTPILTDIPNADSKSVLFKINGTVFLVNNTCPNNGFWERKRLSILKLSDRLSYETVCSLETDEPFFYPHALVDKEREKVLIAYENARQHYLAEISFEELNL